MKVLGDVKTARSPHLPRGPTSIHLHSQPEPFGSNGATPVKAMFAALFFASLVMGCADLMPPEQRPFVNPCPAGKTYMRAFNSCW